MHRAVVTLVAVIALLLAAAPAGAEADGPDYWNVAGIAPGDALSLRAGPGAASRVVGRIPFDAKGLRNLGCRGTVSFARWQRVTEAEKASSRRSRWCRVEFRGRSGWVAGRYLVEGGPPH